MKPYFSHDEGARNDPKLVQVMMDLGHEGKSVYWDLVEMLYEQGGYLMLSQCKGYAFALRTTSELILKLVKDFGLFKDDGEKFWSETALRRLGQRNAKSEKAKESAAKRWSTSERNANALPAHSEGNAIKVNKTKVKDDVVAGKDEVVKTPLNPARDAAIATGDPAEEQHWSESPLVKPKPFEIICIRLGYEGIAYEKYRKQALFAAEEGNISRTIKQWGSWIGKYLVNQEKGGPLIKQSADMPTEITPRHLWPAPGQETPGQIIVVRGDHDQYMNSMLVEAHQRNWPTAIIHAIRP